MRLSRTIGRWAMTALVINIIIGSGIFGLPSELIRLVGRRSPLAVMAGALVMGIIMAPLAELASQFSEPGGLYMYTGAAFGRFTGLQIGWFWLLSATSGAAAAANLFVNYLATFLPAAAHGPWRVAAILLVIVIPTIANYVGVRSGTILSTFLTLAKLLPIAFLTALWLLRDASSSSPSPHPMVQTAAGGWGGWLSALLLLLYSYGGYEDALVPTGEVREPRRTIPFALGTGLAVSALVYTLLQLVVVATLGATGSERPLVDTASILLGRSGASFIGVSVMVSTYGWLSASFLSVPRFFPSLAAHHDCPAWLGKLHPRFHTPSRGLLVFALLVGLLAATGSFLWVLALSAGSMTILYGVGCAAMIRMRRREPHRPALRIPFGEALATMGMIISAALISRLNTRQVLLVCLTAMVATLNWVWARRNTKRIQRGLVLSLATGEAASYAEDEPRV